MNTICWDVNSWARVTRESHEHWSPTNNDDFTVCLIQGHCIFPLLRKCEKTITRFQEVLSRQVFGTYYILPMIFHLFGLQTKFWRGQLHSSEHFGSCETPSKDWHCVWVRFRWSSRRCTGCWDSPLQRNTDLPSQYR